MMFAVCSFCPMSANIASRQNTNLISAFAMILQRMYINTDYTKTC